MTAICITGMHRSGTSMVTRLLMLCGLDIGEAHELIPPAPDNPKGFWEHAPIKEINENLLNELGGAWDSPPTLRDGWHEDPRLGDLRDRAARALEHLQGESGLWGWKDPRCSLTMPFWSQLVDDMRVVVCLRHPLEVAVSLRSRHNLSLALGLRLWHTYTRSVVDLVPPDRRIVTHYDSYFPTPNAELRRVAAFVGLDPADDDVAAAAAAADGALRHGRFRTSDLRRAGVSREVASLYTALAAEAGWDDDAAARVAPARKRLAPATTTADVGQVNALAVDLELALQTNRALRARIDRMEKAAPQETVSLAQRLERTEAMLEEAEERATAAVTTRLDRIESALGDLERLVRAQAYDTRTGIKRALGVAGEYDDVVDAVRRAVADLVPPGSRLVVVSQGDAEIVDLYGLAAEHFPRTSDGEWASYHPADSLAALAQLEAARARGATHFVLPAPSRWWFDHYAEFGAAIRDRFECVYDGAGGLVFDLAATRLGVGDVVDAVTFGFRAAHRRDPTILDWGTSFVSPTGSLSAVLVVPPTEGPLPYVDGVVDVVLFDGDPRRAEEAKRLAATAVVAVDRGRAELAWSALPAAAMAATVVLLDDPAAGLLHDTVAGIRESIASCIDVHVIGPARLAAEAKAANLPFRDLPPGGPGEQLAAAARMATTELVAVVRAGTRPLPGWLPPLAAAVVGDEGAGLAMPRVIDGGGFLVSAGVAMGPDASLVAVGAGDPEPSRSPYVFTRRVTACPPDAFVVRTGVLAGAAHLSGWTTAAYAAAHLSAVVTARRRHVWFQPDSVVVRVAADNMGAAPADRARFLERWAPAPVAPSITLPSEKADWSAVLEAPLAFVERER